MSGSNDREITPAVGSESSAVVRPGLAPVIPDPHAFTSDGPYFRALDTYARKVAQRLKKLEHHAAALADALDGYQESCGEGHARPNYKCSCCGGEEATLTAYKEFITTDWA